MVYRAFGTDIQEEYPIDSSVMNPARQSVSPYFISVSEIDITF